MVEAEGALPRDEGVVREEKFSASSSSRLKLCRFQLQRRWAAC